MTPAKRQPRDELLVCHHGLTALALVNPTRMPTVRVARRSRTGAWGPRSEPEAELLPVKPACSLALQRCGTLNRPYRAVACPQAPPARRCPCRRMVMLALTCKPLSSSTTDTRGPSLARSFVEQKASQSLPALQTRAPSQGGRRPRGDRPETLFRSACAFDLCQPCGWALLEACQGRRLTDPAPDAGSRSRHHPSTRVSRRQRLCLPSWAPRWSPLKRSTPPWTFGQGADPCAQMALRIPGLIHQQARDPISLPTRLPPPRRWRVTTLRGCRNARTEPDHTFIFKTDRAGLCMRAWLAQPLGRRHAVWSRVPP